MSEVAIEEDEPRFLYHDPNVLKSTIDMFVVEHDDERVEGLVPCSECYDIELKVNT